MTKAVAIRLSEGDWIKVDFDRDPSAKVDNKTHKALSGHLGRIEKIVRNQQGLLYKLHNFDKLLPLWCLERLLHYDVEKGTYV